MNMQTNPIASVLRLVKTETLEQTTAKVKQKTLGKLLTELTEGLTDKERLALPKFVKNLHYDLGEEQLNLETWLGMAGLVTFIIEAAIAEELSYGI